MFFLHASQFLHEHTPLKDGQIVCKWVSPYDCERDDYSGD